MPLEQRNEDDDSMSLTKLKACLQTNELSVPYSNIKHQRYIYIYTDSIEIQ